MTILQAQTDLMNIAAAIDKENEIAGVARKNIGFLITTIRNNMNAALDALEEELSAATADRAKALESLIGAPEPVEFKQAAE